MATIEQYTGDVLPKVMMGTIGSAGDLIYLSTGSGLTYKTASTGTGVSNKFAGVLMTDAVAGSYYAIAVDRVVQLEKHTSANKIEAGDQIYGTKSSNKVGTLAGGTALGVCIKQSVTSDTYVSVRLLPFWEMGVGGFHA